MGWATTHIQRLQANETISFRPRGNSMEGKISSGQLCTVIPITKEVVLQKGDIVLCKVNGNQYLHIITAINGNQYQISNNKGHVNGWTSINQIYGKCIRVED